MGSEMCIRDRSNIDVELKRRHDLIPRIAETIKGLQAHERGTQELVALLRAQYAISPDAARGTEAKVVGVSRPILAIAEAYPQLTASDAFLRLQQELAATENRIAMARTYYNGVAQAFNTRLMIVPDAWLASIARLQPFAFFEATGLERESVRVEFAQ